MSFELGGQSIELGERKTDPVTHNPLNEDRKFGPLFNSKMSLERILSILILIVTIALLVLLVIILHSTLDTRYRIIDENKIKEAEVPCLTLTCLQAAVEIKNSLNTHVDPCDDFNQFVCGNWESEQVLTQGRSKYSIFEFLGSKLNKMQKKLLEGSEFKSISPVYSKAIRLYNSCLNIDKLNELGAKPLQNYINKLFGKYGGWEMQFDDENSSLAKWDLMKVIEDPLIETPVFKITVQADRKNSSRNIFTIYLADLYLSKTILENPLKPENKKKIDHFKEYMYEIYKLLNLKQKKINEIDEILTLEIQIYKKYPTDEELRNPNNTYYNIMKIKDLQNKYCPEFNWKEIFRRRMEMVKIQMNDDMDVNVVSPVHLREICKLFKYDATTKRTIHNYVIWRSLDRRIDYLSEDFLRAKEKFENVYYGGLRKMERWERCVTVVQNRMGRILGDMYVKSDVRKSSKSQVAEMINLIKAKFLDNLLSNTWMDEKTKSEAIKKIDAISPKIGFSDSILSIADLEKTFEDIEISDEDYFENIDKLKKGELFKNFGKLLNRPKDATSSNIPFVNAFYSSLRNEITFSSGILQSPFYEPGFPQSLNYGGIGIVMGHELTHGLMYNRSKYDLRGNISFGWTEETRKIFKQKSNCFVKQYSKYSMHGHYLNGSRNLRENIADSGGLRSAYQAYKDLKEKHGKEKRLPGLNFTDDQLFFISFSRLWCNVQTKKSIISEILTDPHTPHRYRAIGTLSNFKEFSEAFNCPLGSPMNPPEKCVIW